jgi:hypothetical protein
MEASRAMGPVEFRFTDPEDVEKYGADWYRTGEEDLIRMRARDLIELETDLGMSIIDAMNGMRMRTTIGELVFAWLGVRAKDEELAGDFDDFNPLTLLITWRPAVDEGKAPEAEATPQPPADTTPAPEDRSHLEVSEPTDTVVLQTSPIAE